MNGMYDRIVLHYARMTTAERKVADYFLHHKPDIQMISIIPIAEACAVSPATLTRFSRKLGCENFNDFRNRVCQVSQPNTLHTQYQEVQAQDSVGEKSQKLLHVYSKALHSTQALISEEGITEAVDLLWQAKNVYCFGQGSSNSVALDTVTRFAPISAKFHWISDSHLQSTTAALLQENDVILYFSFSGANRELVETGKLVSNTPGKLILVTGFPNSPGVSWCDVLLQCGANDSPKNQGSMAAKIVQLYIVDILFNEYTSRDVLSAVQNRQKTLAATESKMLADQGNNNKNNKQLGGHT